MNRVRIITAEGQVTVRDKSFSQTIEMLRGLDKAARAAFWLKQETVLPCGHSVLLIHEGA